MFRIKTILQGWFYKDLPQIGERWIFKEQSAMSSTSVYQVLGITGNKVQLKELTSNSIYTFDMKTFLKVMKHESKD